MNALAGTFHGMGEHPSAQHLTHLTAIDLFVIATLVVLFFLLGCFATWSWLIWRRGHKPKPHVQLLMELEEADMQSHLADEHGRLPAGSDTDMPWEKPGDWWKKQS